MNGKLIALFSAAVLTLSLTACSGGRTDMPSTRTGENGTMTRENKAGMDRRSNQGGSAWKDGKYWANGDGQVSRRPKDAESDWEKMGRQIQDGFDDLMNGAGNAAGDVGRGAMDAARDAGRGVENAARDAGTGVKRAGEAVTNGR